MIVHAGGIDIFYEQQGTGRPMLLLHGNGEDHTVFDGLAAALAAEYSVYAPDTRCHGQSSQTESLGYEAMAEDAAAFIAALGLEKPVVVGFSDGGITGLLLAIRHPDLLGGLVACGANTRPDQLKPWFLLVARLGYMFTKDPKLKLMLTQPDIRPEQLADIRVPVLVLAGSRDILPTAGTLAIAEAIPGALVQILQGETHSSYVIQRPGRLLAAMGPFLRGL